MKKDQNQPADKKQQASEEGYDVGYGKPPKHTQFKKGQSGNPAGRPKGRKTARVSIKNQEKLLFDYILEENQKEITIKENGRSIKITRGQAILRSLWINALKGSVYAQKASLQLTKQAEDKAAADHATVIDGWIKYKSDWEKELKRRQREGITYLDEPIIHPDNVVIDPISGELEIYGPVTNVEKQGLETYKELLKETQETLKRLRKKRPKIIDAEDLVSWDEEIVYFQKLSDLLNDNIESTNRPISFVEDIAVSLEMLKDMKSTKKAKKKKKKMKKD